MPSGVNLRLLEQKFAKLEAKERQLSIQLGRNGTSWKIAGLKSASALSSQNSGPGDAGVVEGNASPSGGDAFSGLEDMKSRSVGARAVAANEERVKRQIQRDYISGVTFAKARAQQLRESDRHSSHQSPPNLGGGGGAATSFEGLFDHFTLSGVNTEEHAAATVLLEDEGVASNAPTTFDARRAPSPNLEGGHRATAPKMHLPSRPPHPATALLDPHTIKGASLASASQGRRGDFWGMPSPSSTTPAATPATMLRPHTADGGGAGTAVAPDTPSYLSRYKNPHPVNIPRRPMTSSARAGASTGVTADGARAGTAASPKSNQPALAGLANLRRILAPALGLPPPPKKPSKFAPKRVLERRPSTAGADRTLAAGTAGPVTAVHDLVHDLHIAYPHVPIEALHKDYYYLHIRVVHQSNLRGWVFSVVLTDVTNSQREVDDDATAPPKVGSPPLPQVHSKEHTLRHVIHGIRCNDHKYLVFHPPSGVVLSPVDDIPWVPSAPFLYQRVLRVEVHATQPTKAKVVDMLVRFGSGEDGDGAHSP